VRRFTAPTEAKPKRLAATISEHHAPLTRPRASGLGLAALKMANTIPPPPNETPAPVALARNPLADLDAIARLLRAGEIESARKLADRWVK
jgi:hypothetical protein